MDSEKECEICYNKYTKRKKKITCSKCNFSSCFECIKQYVEIEGVYPCCINCKNNFDMYFLSKNVPKCTMNSFRKIISKIDIEKEKNLLPETIVYVENLNEADKLENELDEVRNNIKQLRIYSDILSTKIYNLRNFNNIESKKERRSFICPCPGKECKGFLNNKYKCDLCKISVCKDCRGILKENEEHKCDEDDIKSVKNINKTTKPCPKCGTRIFKPSGCDHMFCTKVGCYTSFSWKLGTVIDESLNTNPHYYEWRRQNGILEREPGDVRCGGLPNFQQVNMSIKYNFPKIIVNKVFAYHRAIRHIRMFDLNEYRIDPFQENRDVRIKYLQNKITDENWVKLLKRKRKKRDLYSQIYQLLSMFLDSMEEQFRDLVVSSAISQCDIIETMDNLIDYCEDQLDSIKYTFNSKMSYSIKNYIH